MPPARPPRRNILLAVGGTLVLVGIAIALLAAWQFREFEEWLAKDGDTLSPYANVIYPASQGAAGNGELDVALLSGLSKGRLVEEVSRSDYRLGTLGSTAWVKVHLTTALPGESKNLVRIKLLARLRRDEGQWTLYQTRELVLP